MSAFTSTDVRMFLRDYLGHKLEASGRGACEDLPEDCDLLLSGIVDSLGLLEVVTALTDHFDQEICFETLDPEQMTLVGPLCRYVAEQLSRD